ncbi:MAG TPA: hypothetical protein VMU05_16190 [Dongiaceae bacterium]|nr:hypothetical protein [Dongiaceae bacterium]
MATPIAKQFTIPIDVLKSFQHEVRFVPQLPHNNGYMILDMDMLISVLRRGDPKAAATLADNMEALKKSQAELVIMQKVVE